MRAYKTEHNMHNMIFFTEVSKHNKMQQML